MKRFVVNISGDAELSYSGYHIIPAQAPSSSSWRNIINYLQNTTRTVAIFYTSIASVTFVSTAEIFFVVVVI